MKQKGGDHTMKCKYCGEKMIVEDDLLGWDEIWITCPSFLPEDLPEDEDHESYCLTRGDDGMVVLS